MPRHLYHHVIQLVPIQGLGLVNSAIAPSCFGKSFSFSKLLTKPIGYKMIVGEVRNFVEFGIYS
jgi:Na+/serine symporter